MHTKNSKDNNPLPVLKVNPDKTFKQSENLAFVNVIVQGLKDIKAGKTVTLETAKEILRIQ